MEIKTQSFLGRKFKVVKGTTHPEYSFYTFEADELEFREKFWTVKPDEVVFDIGAAYGAYTLAALALGARVQAFEPEPTICTDLVSNVMLNNWSGLCGIHNYGLWDGRDNVDMRSYAPHWPTQTITGSYEMRTLDAVAEGLALTRLDWIKIDVEGAEARVILGGLKTIAKFGPKLIIECHTFLDAELPNKVKQALLSVRGYTFEAVDRPPCILLVGTPT